MNPPCDTLYLIDSSIYVFRAWFILPDSITDPHGQPVNAVYGFADFLAQMLEQSRATHVTCAFDQSLSSSIRNTIYADYKANRDPAPAELKHQFALCRELAGLFGLRHEAHPHYEADDIIGTLAMAAREQQVRTSILSADKDLTQFVGVDDEVWDFSRGHRLDQAAVQKKFGVYPAQIADLLALCGDKVDNIPGIPGVGVATAARLLKKWETLDNLFAHIDDVASMKFRGAARVSVLLREHESTVRLARRLTGLLPVEALATDIASSRRRVPSTDELREFLDRLGFSERRQQRLVTSLERSF